MLEVFNNINNGNYLLDSVKDEKPLFEISCKSTYGWDEGQHYTDKYKANSLQEAWNKWKEEHSPGWANYAILSIHRQDSKGNATYPRLYGRSQNVDNDIKSYKDSVKDSKKHKVSKIANMLYGDSCKDSDYEEYIEFLYLNTHFDKNELFKIARDYYKSHAKYRREKIEDRKEYYHEHQKSQNAYANKDSVKDAKKIYRINAYKYDIDEKDWEACKRYLESKGAKYWVSDYLDIMTEDYSVANHAREMLHIPSMEKDTPKLRKEYEYLLEDSCKDDTVDLILEKDKVKKQQEWVKANLKKFNLKGAVKGDDYEIDGKYEDIKEFHKAFKEYFKVGKIDACKDSKSTRQSSKVIDGQEKFYKKIKDFDVYTVNENGEIHYKIKYKGVDISECDEDELMNEINNIKIEKKKWYVVMHYKKPQSYYKSKDLAKEEVARIQMDKYEKGWYVKELEEIYVDGQKIN